jgi:tRNA(adenine34) deaminase
MGLALDEAMAATDSGEVPVGAVLISAQGRILAKAHNAPIAMADPTAHAEILCLRQAAREAGNYRLAGSILAVTLEPCLMCLGALVQARVAGVIFGARDAKAGALVSHLGGPELPFLNHRFWVMEGVLANEASRLLSGFFARRRRNP